MDSGTDLDGFQVLVSQHQLLLQLHDLAHGLILHVLQLLCHLKTRAKGDAIKTLQCFFVVFKRLNQITYLAG